MPRRIRIVEERRQPTLVEKLEAEAHRAAKRSTGESAGFQPEAAVRREIALTLDHIHRVRQVHNDLRRNLVKLECYIDTEIMQREPKPPHFYDKRIAERDMLRARLLRIEHERRQLAVVERERLQTLHDRLLILLERHRQLRPVHSGYRNARSEA